MDIKEAQEYLESYGYLETPLVEAFGFATHKAFVGPLDTSSRGIKEARTTAALQAFQNFVGLPPTGELDDDTLEFMEHKRCGFPDIGSFVLQGNKWDDNNVTYKFLDLTTDLNEATVKRALRDAFALWANVTPLVFTESSIADIEIRFVHGEHGDGSPFDSVNGVLAHAYFPPPNGGDLAGDCHFDDAEPWTDTGNGIDLVTVACHEIGHALGLAHSNVQGSMMFPYYSGAARFLHQDDVAGVQALYGSKPVVEPVPPVPVPPPSPPVPPTPPVEPPVPPTPPLIEVFSFIGLRSYHDYHSIRTSREVRRWPTAEDAVAAGLKACRICKPRIP